MWNSLALEMLSSLNENQNDDTLKKRSSFSSTVRAQIEF